MGIFNEHNKKQNSIFDDIDKKRGGTLNGGGSEVNLLKNILFDTRLSNANYLNGISKPQAVFKIINSGSGFNALSLTSKYIARDLSYQKDKESLTLLDEEGNPIVDYNDIVKEWASDFESIELNEKQQWKVAAKDKLEERKNELIYYSESRALEKRELIELSSIKAQIAGDYVIINDKETGQKKKISTKVNLGTDFYHMMFSVGGTNHNQKKLHQAMGNTIRTQFSTKGMQSFFVLHTDTENDHFHVVLNSRSAITGKQVYFDKVDLFAIRQSFAQELERVGIKRGAVARKDNPLIISKIMQQVEGIQHGFNVYEKKLQTGNVDAIKYKQTTLKKLDFLISAINGSIKISDDTKDIAKNLKILKKDRENLNNKYTKEKDFDSLVSLKKQIKSLDDKILKQEVVLEKNNKKALKDKRKDLNIIRKKLIDAITVGEINSTVNELEKIDNNFASKFKQLEEIKPDKKGLVYKVKKSQQLREQLKEHREEVKQAIKFFKTSRNKTNSDSVDIALNRLNSLMKSNKKIKR
tara:strand:- start:21815 stop:23389 length:1575 start_codon:yes stop_codon:yes gene_type:complete